MELYESFNETLRHLAELGRTQVGSQLLIGLRILVVLSVIICINAQVHSWGLRNMNAGRWATVIGWLLTGIAAMMSALITAHMGGNAALFQFIFLVGVMFRVSADIANAGNRRAANRECTDCDRF